MTCVHVCVCACMPCMCARMRMYVCVTWRRWGRGVVECDLITWRGEGVKKGGGGPHPSSSTTQQPPHQHSVLLNGLTVHTRAHHTVQPHSRTHTCYSLKYTCLLQPRVCSLKHTCCSLQYTHMPVCYILSRYIRDGEPAQSVAAPAASQWATSLATHAQT